MVKTQSLDALLRGSAAEADEEEDDAEGGDEDWVRPSAITSCAIYTVVISDDLIRSSFHDLSEARFRLYQLRSFNYGSISQRFSSST